jgi:hypothetical protein
LLERRAGLVVARLERPLRRGRWSVARTGASARQMGDGRGLSGSARGGRGWRRERNRDCGSERGQARRAVSSCDWSLTCRSAYSDLLAIAVLLPASHARPSPQSTGRRGRGRVRWLSQRIGTLVAGALLCDLVGR